MKTSALRSKILLNLAWLLILLGCVSQNEVTSLDTRLSELELRNAESREKSEALKSELQTRDAEKIRAKVREMLLPDLKTQIAKHMNQ